MRVGALRCRRSGLDGAGSSSDARRSRGTSRAAAGRRAGGTLFHTPPVCAMIRASHAAPAVPDGRPHDLRTPGGRLRRAHERRAGRSCTWESGPLAKLTPIFAGIPPVLDVRPDSLTCSHVHRGGSAHMGASRPRPPAQRFRMIPRFRPVRVALECATPS